MNNSVQLLTDKLDAALNELASTKHFLIGLSGGLDSVVLLHAMTQLREKSNGDMQLRAIHVNHRLHSEADSWAQHCERLCAKLGIEFCLREVSITDSTGIENAARAARYGEFEACLLATEELVLGHHRDDQMETLLLRLIRGAGSRGLSGIPSSRALGASRLLRPLLDIERNELRGYGEAAGLDWVEDTSNSDESFDRNYCRHSLLPLIEARWPGYRESWSKSAVLAAESEVLLQELARIDLAAIATESPARVSREKLLALSEPRRRNALRCWLAGLGGIELSWNQLQQLSNEVLNAQSGRFLGDGFEIHCFCDHVHVLDASVLSDIPDAATAQTTLTVPFSAAVALPGNGSLEFRETRGAGLATAKLGSLSVRYRRGGEVCKLVGRPSKTLKKILQETDVPPWMRSRYPLIFSGETLACIPGIGVCEDFAASATDAGYSVEWRQPDTHLGA